MSSEEVRSLTVSKTSPRLTDTTQFSVILRGNYISAALLSPSLDIHQCAASIASNAREKTWLG
jgi:hypothetical protein